MKVVCKRAMVLIIFCCFFFLSPVYGGKQEIPILMYHNLAEQTEDTYVTITPQQFRQDMQYLYDNGFTPLLPEDLIAIAEGRQVMPVRPVMITFDDGYESNYIYAYPILKEMGMKATIAVISGYIRSEYSQPNQYLTWSQCKEMSDSGLISIQSHSHMLHNPENCGIFVENQPNGIQRKQGETLEQYQARVGSDLQQSISAIEYYVGKPVVYFAYPFGVVDTWFPQLSAFSGIKVTTTTTWEIASLANGLQAMPRFDIGSELPVKDIPQIQNSATRTETAYGRDYSVMYGERSIILPSYIIRDERYTSLEAIVQFILYASITCDPTTKNIGINFAAANMTAIPTSVQGNVQKVAPSNTRLVIDGNVTPRITYYIIDGNHYFRLRDITPYLNIDIH